jgi:hypothetical protein
LDRLPAKKMPAGVCCAAPAKGYWPMSIYDGGSRPSNLPALAVLVPLGDDTNAAAWRWIDRHEGEAISRSEAVSDWIASKDDRK